MSLENAQVNLQELSKELKLDLSFDQNNTCILGIDNAFSLHLTYESNSDRIYLYSPLLDGLPKEDHIRLRLYEALLQGSILGSQMVGGGVGVSIKEELILMHTMLEMSKDSDIALLRRFAPMFVDSVEKWRKIIQDILAGKEVKVEDSKMPIPSGSTDKLIKI